MRVPIATKVTKEQKLVLEYLAFRDGRKKPAELIRSAVVDAYDLDSTKLYAEAVSFFDGSARHVDQSSNMSGNGREKARQTARSGR